MEQRADLLSGKGCFQRDQLFHISGVDQIARLHLIGGVDGEFILEAGVDHVHLGQAQVAKIDIILLAEQAEAFELARSLDQRGAVKAAVAGNRHHRAAEYGDIGGGLAALPPLLQVCLVQRERAAANLTAPQVLEALAVIGGDHAERLGAPEAGGRPGLVGVG